MLVIAHLRCLLLALPWHVILSTGVSARIEHATVGLVLGQFGALQQLDGSGGGTKKRGTSVTHGHIVPLTTQWFTPRGRAVA